MYEIGEYVIYGTDGVCKVEKIGASSLPEMSQDKQYYTLCPIYEKGCEIVTPVDQSRVVMRKILGSEEVTALIDRIGDLPEIWVREEKKREEDYKEVIRSCDCERLLSMIKTLHRRKQMRLDAGKKVTAKDMKYFAMAENNLYGEFAVVLKMSPMEVKNHIAAKVKEKEAEKKKAAEEAKSKAKEVKAEVKSKSKAVKAETKAPKETKETKETKAAKAKSKAAKADTKAVKAEAKAPKEAKETKATKAKSKAKK